MSGYSGLQDETAMGSDLNAHTFVVKQLLAKVGTSTVVKIVKVNNGGGALAVGGSVDVQPMVHQVDGDGKATPHGIIHNVPYSRMQGGGHGIIMDPKVGDMGIMVVASRDISSVKANKAPSNPGSARRHDLADGMYVGGLGSLNGTPTQYIQFTDAGVTIHSPGGITINAPTVTIQGDIVATGTITSNGKRIDDTHKHISVSVGTGVSGVPQ